MLTAPAQSLLGRLESVVNAEHAAGRCARLVGEEGEVLAVARAKAPVARPVREEQVRVLLARLKGNTGKSSKTA
jgi:hypothetical protein